MFFQILFLESCGAHPPSGAMPAFLLFRKESLKKITLKTAKKKLKKQRNKTLKTLIKHLNFKSQLWSGFYYLVMMIFFTFLSGFTFEQI